MANSPIESHAVRLELLARLQESYQPDQLVVMEFVVPANTINGQTKDEPVLLVRFGSAIEFETDKYDIPDAGQELLADMAKRILRDRSPIVIVAGHTDNVGSEIYNLILSERRARSVQDYLGLVGLDRSKLSALPFGEFKPRATNSTFTGRRQNRRVEVFIGEMKAAVHYAAVASNLHECQDNSDIPDGKTGCLKDATRLILIPAEKEDSRGTVRIDPRTLRSLEPTGAVAERLALEPTSSKRRLLEPVTQKRIRLLPSQPSTAIKN